MKVGGWLAMMVGAATRGGLFNGLGDSPLARLQRPRRLDPFKDQPA